MEKKLIEELKEKLEAEKNSIQEKLKKFATEDKDLKYNWDAKYPNREDGDKDEEADEVQEYENMVSLEHELETKLKDVLIALDKIKNNTYGVCEKCGKEIDKERLLAYPAAKICLKCNGKK